jgi:hypothetical protein
MKLKLKLGDSSLYVSRAKVFYQYVDVAARQPIQEKDVMP